MGKKKGRQRGNFATKSQRAAHQTELRIRAYEDVAEHRVVKAHSAGSAGSWRATGSGAAAAEAAVPSSLSLTSASSRPQASRVSLTQLRGILRERMIEDTIEYQIQRRRHNSSSSRRNGSSDSADPSRSVRLVGEGAVDRHEPGWLLWYETNHNHENSNGNDDCDDTNHRVCSVDPSKGCSNESCATCKDDGNCSQRRRCVGGRSEQPRGMPTLQSLCVKSLGPALHHYVTELGVPTVHAVLDTLPSTMIAELSASYCAGAYDSYHGELGKSRSSSNSSSNGGTVRSGDGTNNGSPSYYHGIDDDMLDVLGRHDHIDGLALHAATGRTRGRRLTARGILSLVPRLISTSSLTPSSTYVCSSSSSDEALKNNAYKNDNDEHDYDHKFSASANVAASDDGAPDSWEEMLDDDRSSCLHADTATFRHNVRVEGCTRLTRLELCNVQGDSSDDDDEGIGNDDDDDNSTGCRSSPASSVALARATSSLLRRCPRITHLSLSGSFDGLTGPALLLDPTNGIAALLPNLRVLDLSHCPWVTDSLLLAFLRRLGGGSDGRGGGKDRCKGGSTSKKSSSMELISVAGCTGVTERFLSNLNGEWMAACGGLPLMCTEVRRCSIGNEYSLHS